MIHAFEKPLKNSRGCTVTYSKVEKVGYLRFPVFHNIGHIQDANAVKCLTNMVNLLNSDGHSGYGQF